MRSTWPTLALVGLLLALLLAALAYTAARHPLRRAWRASQAQAGYQVMGESHVGAPAHSATWQVSGSGKPSGSLRLDLRPEDGSAGDPGIGAVRLTIDWPQIRAESQGHRASITTTLSSSATAASSAADSSDAFALSERSLGVLLPAGDPLLLLATAHAPRTGELELVSIMAGYDTTEDAPASAASRMCRRVDFLVGARAYATFWQAHPSHLPVNANAGGLWKFGGQGTAWLDPHTDLPCRIQASLVLPRLVDDRPGTAEVDWIYHDWRSGAARP